MSKLNIYYICIFALILVCVSGLSDVSSLRRDNKKNKIVNGMNVANSNNDGEDLIVKKRSNIEEDGERELEETTPTELDDGGSTSSTAATTPEVTTTESSATEDGESATTTPASTGSTTTAPSETTTPASTGSSTTEIATTSDTTTTESTGSVITETTTTITEGTTKPEVTTTFHDDEDDDTTTEIETTTPEVTTTLPPPGAKTECPYEYNTYKFLSRTTEKILYPSTAVFGSEAITYNDISCNPDVGKGIVMGSDGNITVTPNIITQDKVTCTVTCKAGDHPNGSTPIEIYFIEYKPTGLNPILTYVPAMVKESDDFTIRLGLKYPSVTDISDQELNANMKIVTVNISEIITSHYNITEDGNAVSEKSSNLTFKWEELQIGYEGNDEKSGIENVIINVKNYSDGCNIDETFTIQVNHDKKCKYSEDPQGLCCDGRKYKGEYCTKVQGAFSFERSGSFNEFYEIFNRSINSIFEGSPYWYDDKTDDNDKKDYKIRFILTYIEGGKNPNFGATLPPNERRILEGEFKWDNFFTNNKDVDPIQFGNVLLSIVGPSDKSDGTIEIPPELKGTPIGNALQTVVDKPEVKQAVKTITQEANNKGIKKSENYFEPTTQIGDKIDHSPGDKDPWAKRYWWAILLMCIGGVLIIAIVVAIIVIATSSSGSSKSNKKDIEKSEKIMETIIPIEKIKQENEISDEDIYKPFTYEVIMEGYLLKAGHDRVVGKWQRRYCVLYFDPAVLRIYESMVPSYYGKVYIDERQSIPLECYNGIEYKDGSNEFTLILKVRDSSIKAFEVGDKERKIAMKVEGENGVETCKKWVECFRDFKNQKPKAGDAWTRPLIIDQSNGKITTSTNKAAEKKNEEIVLKAQQRRQAISTSK